MAKTNHPENKVSTPATQPVITGSEKHIERPLTYVVVRDGYRVSDLEYSTPDGGGNATVEKEFWTRVAKKHSHGEPVEIVQYDPKKHRVW
jgi:hypothetical protein